jgi:hypothetical protein
MTPSNSVAYNPIFVCLVAGAVVWTCAAVIIIRLYCVGLITYVLKGPAQPKK